MAAYFWVIPFQLQVTQHQRKVVQILSRKYVALIEKCSHLELASSAPILNLFIGILLMAIYVGGTIYFKFFKKIGENYLQIHCASHTRFISLIDAIIEC